MIIICVVLFFLGFLEASGKFHGHLENLKDCIRNGTDISPVIDAFNTDSANFTATDHLVLREYLATREDAVCLLYDNRPINFRSPQMILFVRYLIKDAYCHSHLLSQEKVLTILEFLSLAPSQTNSRDLLKVCSKLLFQLTPEQNSRFVTFNSGASYYTGPDDSRDTEVENRIIQLSLQEFPDQYEIFSILRQISEENMIINSNCLIKIAKLLQKLDFRQNPDWFRPVLAALRDITTKHRQDLKFLEPVIDFIFSDQVATELLAYETPIEDYSMLNFLVLKNAKYVGESPMSNVLELSKGIYAESNKKIITMMGQVIHLNNITNNASENELKDALNSLLALKKLVDEDAFTKKILKIDKDKIFSRISDITEIYADDFHPLNGLAWKVVCQLGLLGLKITEKYDLNRIDAFSNTATAISNLIHASIRDIRLYPSEQLAEISPVFDEVLENTINQMKILKTTLNYDHMNRFIKFASLHPSEARKKSYIDRVLKHFLSDMPTRINHFNTVSSSLVSDKRGVYYGSFLSHVQEYVKNPSPELARYLREFYTFIKRQNLITKMESEILEQKFRIFAN